MDTDTSNFELLSINQNTELNTMVIKETKYRWVIFTCFCFAMISNSIHYTTFSMIYYDLTENLGYSKDLIANFGLVFLYVFPVFYPFAAYLIDHKSLNIGIILASFLNIISAVMKVFFNQNVEIALVGQIFSAISQPFILSSTGKVANVWFRENKRGLIISLFIVANALGSFFGTFFSRIIFSIEFTTVDKYREELFDFLLYEGIIVTVLSLPSIFLFKSKPKHPPSALEEKKVTPSLKEGVKLLMKNKNFIYLLIIFGVILGYTNMIYIMISQYLGNQGMDQHEISLFFSIGTGLGNIGLLLNSYIVSKFNNYKRLIIILLSILLLSQILITILIETLSKSDSYYAIIVIYIIILYIISSSIGIGLDLVCKITYPVGELISNGMVFCLGQIVGIAETHIGQKVVEENGYVINVIVSITFIVAYILVFLIDEDYQ